jgi:signal transduction histidine kinase
MREEGRTENWREFVFPIGVVVVGLFLAVASFFSVRAYYETQEHQQFRRNATSLATIFKGDVARHVTSLAAIRAFVTSSRVTRWEFSTYAHQILPLNLGLRAVVWVPKVGKAERGAYEAGLQRDGLYGLRIRELTEKGEILDLSERPSYAPISYVEPLDGNLSLVGLDISRIPRYAQLFHDASETGHVAASAPLSQTLVAGRAEPAVLLAFPLSANSGVGLGYALAVLQFSSIIAQANRPSDDDIQAALGYQGKGTPTIWSGGGRQSAARWFGKAKFQQLVPFSIAGRHFLLAMRSVGHEDLSTSLYIPACAALLIVALTALLAQNMSATLLRKWGVERAVVVRTAELSAANGRLVLEIEQRRQVEAALRIARDKAESANRAKSAFMAVMSHELRTPLNAIIGFSGILTGAEGSFPRQGEYAGEILSNGYRLLDLINDILDLAQMEAGEQPAERDLIYLSDCVPTLIAKAEGAARAAGVTLKAAVPNDLPALYGDSKRVSRAIGHLIANAVKFTPAGGSAAVQARAADTLLIVEVMDTGVGISSEARQRIFDSFAQSETQLGRRYEGAGLGLTYVAKVAALHDAALDIVSETGRGTCVRLAFKCAQSERVLEVA